MNRTSWPALLKTSKELMKEDAETPLILEELSALLQADVTNNIRVISENCSYQAHKANKPQGCSSKIKNGLRKSFVDEFFRCWRTNKQTYKYYEIVCTSVVAILSRSLSNLSPRKTSTVNLSGLNRTPNGAFLFFTSFEPVSVFELNNMRMNAATCAVIALALTFVAFGTLSSR